MQRCTLLLLPIDLQQHLHLCLLLTANVLLPIQRKQCQKKKKKKSRVNDANAATNAATGNHVKQLNTASSDSELHRFRTKPLSSSMNNVGNDVRFKQHSQDRDSLVSSSKQGILFSPIGLKHNVTEKVAQVGGLVRITAFLLICMPYHHPKKVLWSHSLLVLLARCCGYFEDEPKCYLLSAQHNL